MKITIESVVNGWVLETEEGKEVFQEDESKEKDLVALQHLLYSVLEALGEYGSKHDQERLRIEIVSQREGE